MLEKLRQRQKAVLLSPGTKAVYGILAPLIIGAAGFWAVLSTGSGEGPSVGGRGMVLMLVLFPAGFVAAGLLNTWVLLVSLQTRVSVFLIGTIVPAVALVLAYAYLWRTGPFQH